jgi:hypothetical protein
METAFAVRRASGTGLRHFGLCLCVAMGLNLIGSLGWLGAWVLPWWLAFPAFMSGLLVQLLQPWIPLVHAWLDGGWFYDWLGRGAIAGWTMRLTFDLSTAAVLAVVASLTPGFRQSRWWQAMTLSGNQKFAWGSLGVLLVFYRLLLFLIGPNVD